MGTRAPVTASSDVPDISPTARTEARSVTRTLGSRAVVTDRRRRLADRLAREAARIRQQPLGPGEVDAALQHHDGGLDMTLRERDRRLRGIAVHTTDLHDDALAAIVQLLGERAQ